MGQVALGGLFALAGVLIGALLSGLLELWRQVLAGRSAAKIIRMEIQHDMNLCIQAITAGRPDLRLTDEAWVRHRAELAPLLPHNALVGIATSFGALWIAQEWIGKIGTDKSQAETQIKQWLDQLKVHAGLLRQIETRRRLAQFVDLLLGRATFAPAARVPKGEEAPPVPSMDELIKAVEEFDGR